MNPGCHIQGDRTSKCRGLPGVNCLGLRVFWATIRNSFILHWSLCDWLVLISLILVSFSRSKARRSDDLSDELQPMPATSCRRFGVMSQLEERRVDGVGPGQDGKHEYSHVHIMYIFKYEYMINIWELIDACLQHVYNILLMECLYSVCRLKILILEFLSNFYSYWWYILVGNV